MAILHNSQHFPRREAISRRSVKSVINNELKNLSMKQRKPKEQEMIKIHKHND